MIEGVNAVRETGIVVRDIAPGRKLISLVVSVVTPMYGQDGRCDRKQGKMAITSASNIANSGSAQPTFTSVDTLGPCMIKLRVADISTILEPRPVARATGAFTRFLAKPTFETHRTYGGGRRYCKRRRRDACPS